MATVTVERPREVGEIKALIRKRRANVSRLENLLRQPMPRQDRAHLSLRLKGERANLQSWVDYLAKQEAKSVA